MAGLTWASIIALTVWTLWLTFALGRVSKPLSGLFVLLGLLSWIFTDISWRAYAIGALVVHLAALARGDWRERRKAAAFSALGIVWLAAGGGAPYWLTILLPIVLLTAVIAGPSIKRRVRGRRFPWTVTYPPSTPSPGSRSGTAPVDFGPFDIGAAFVDPPDLETTPLVLRQATTGSVGHRVPASGGWAGSTPSFARHPGLRDELPANVERQYSEVFGRAFVMPPAADPPANGIYFGLLTELPVAGAETPSAIAEPATHCFARTRKTPQLTVLAGVSRTVQVRGLARFSPPGRVRVTKSRAVIAGDDGTVHLDEHVRIRQIDVSPGSLLTTNKSALMRFLRGGSVSAFQGSLAGLLDRSGTAPRRVTANVAIDHTVEVHRCEVVHMGGRTSTRIDDRFVVERSTLALDVMLAEDEGLCILLRDALREPAAVAPTTAFLKALLRKVSSTNDDDLVRAIDEAGTDAQIRQLFGVADVTDANVVVVGSGVDVKVVRHVQHPDVDRPSLRDLLDLLGVVSRLVSADGVGDSRPKGVDPCRSSSEIPPRGAIPPPSGGLPGPGFSM